VFFRVFGEIPPRDTRVFLKYAKKVRISFFEEGDPHFFGAPVFLSNKFLRDAKGRIGGILIGA
jgi:hypothetical protein